MFDADNPDLKLPQKLLDAVAEAMAPVTIPEGLDMVSLAREIVMEQELPEVILRRYKLSDEQFEAVKASPFYHRVFTEYTIAWQSASNTAQRNRLQALAIMEQAMPVLGARMMTKSEPLPAAIEAAKLFAKLSGLGEAEQGRQGVHEKFSIQINIGATELKYEKNVTPNDAGDLLQIASDVTEKTTPS